MNIDIGGFLEVGNNFLTGYMSGKALKIERGLAQRKADLAEREFEEVKLARVANDQFRAQTARDLADSQNRLNAARTLRELARTASEPAARRLLELRADEIEFGNIPFKKAQTFETTERGKTHAPRTGAYVGRMSNLNLSTTAHLPANELEAKRISDAIRLKEGLPVPLGAGRSASGGSTGTTGGAPGKPVSATQLKWIEDRLGTEIKARNPKKEDYAAYKAMSPADRAAYEDSIRQELRQRYESAYGPAKPTPAQPDTTFGFEP